MGQRLNLHDSWGLPLLSWIIDLRGADLIPSRVAYIEVTPPQKRLPLLETVVKPVSGLYSLGSAVLVQCSGIFSSPKKMKVYASGLDLSADCLQNVMPWYHSGITFTQFFPLSIPREVPPYERQPEEALRLYMQEQWTYAKQQASGIQRTQVGSTFITFYHQYIPILSDVSGR